MIISLFYSNNCNLCGNTFLSILLFMNCFKSSNVFPIKIQGYNIANQFIIPKNVQCDQSIIVCNQIQHIPFYI